MSWLIEYVSCTEFRLRIRQIRNPPIFENPTKSGSGQSSSRIWRISAVHLQYVQLIMDKTNAADLSRDVAYLQF